MSNSLILSGVINWVKTWDLMAILYSLIAAFIFAVLFGWRRPFRFLLRLWRNEVANRRYSKSLTEECSNLIVVGKRQGFSMSQTFIPLDLVTSDLMHKPDEQKRLGHIDSGLTKTCVLLGGPGAGKSTLVKKRILDELAAKRRHPKPFFLRLRDYVGFNTIEDSLSHELKKHGFVEPEKLLQEIFQMSGICVLDGLDEVKPSFRAKVIDDINVFFHKYYSKRGTLIVTCRREAYLDTPLDIPLILEVRPLRDEKIQAFAEKWPLGFPQDKSASTFWRDLTAIPRIHELARSPLLLIGGLMQYTESNAGVPDERYKYLERIASWLISDWATAQGHPPDHFRPLYDRILPKLAFEMHKRNTSELPIIEAERMIASWLPKFGFLSKQNCDVISSIRTRTGILVADDKNNIIFAQFGLQEYFSSLEMNLVLDPQALGQLQPRLWWRESILIAVAQHRDPNPYLDAIFNVDPILGAAAVAECPTPALEQQTKAVKLCLVEVDTMNDAIKTPVVQLLRKLTGKMGNDLEEELEKRLSDRAKVAKFVGLLLATAGTEGANKALSRHPEVWATCLTDAGYLSDSFEGLLFSWVLKGDDTQCVKATDALFENLQLHNLVRLTNLLPDLSADKADYVAQRVLGLTIRNMFPTRGRMAPNMGSLVINCVPYIRKPDKFLKKHLTEAKDRGIEGRIHIREVAGSSLLYIASLFQMCKRLKQGAPHKRAEAITTWLIRSHEWCVSHALFFCLYAAILAVLSSIYVHNLYRLFIFIGCLALALIAFSSQRPIGIWMLNGGLMHRSVNFLTGTMFALICIGTTLVFVGPLATATFLLNILPISFFVFGLLLRNDRGHSVVLPFEYERIFQLGYRVQNRIFRTDYSMQMISHRDIFSNRSRLVKTRFLLYATILFIFLALYNLLFSPSEPDFFIWIIILVLFLSTTAGLFEAARGHWMSRRAQINAGYLLQKMLWELRPDKVLHRLGENRTVEFTHADLE
ncbi:MAG: NACHT domain-containing protein [Thermodesulfovibrionales bacterium]|nr:NACHT domain-containing protein [Thermodesulfovibrionales bacterium]